MHAILSDFEASLASGRTMVANLGMTTTLDGRDWEICRETSL